MTDAGQKGVLLVAFGTVAQLGAASRFAIKATLAQFLVSSIQMVTSAHADRCMNGAIQAGSRDNSLLICLRNCLSRSFGSCSVRNWQDFN